MISKYKIIINDDEKTKRVTNHKKIIKNIAKELGLLFHENKSMPSNPKYCSSCGVVARNCIC